MRSLVINANMSKGVAARTNERACPSAAAEVRLVAPTHLSGLAAEHHKCLGPSAPPPSMPRGTLPPASDATADQLKKGAP